jgi:DNA-binding CsgD family transcriptional regulator
MTLTHFPSVERRERRQSDGTHESSGSLAQWDASQLAPASRTWAQILHGEGLTPIDDLDRSSTGAEPAAVLALSAGLRGTPSLARRSAARAERFTGERSRTIVGIQLARTLAWMWDADMPAAYQSVSMLFIGDRTHASDGCAAAIGILAEVALRCGQGDAARLALTHFDDSPRDDSAEAQEIALAAAILGGDAGLENAVSARAPKSALVVARLNLAWGLRLRRTGRGREARAPLQAALELFDELDSGTWQRIAARELRVAGHGGVAATTTSPLSTQEMTVAHAISLGLSNREAADLLYLSPRTVSNHLYSIYPKLGVRSRTQLARWYGANFDSSQSSSID